LMAGAFVAGALIAATAGAAMLAPARPLPTTVMHGNARARCSLFTMSAPDADDEHEEARPPNELAEAEPRDADVYSSIELDMSKLAQRISSVNDKTQLERRLDALEQAWVLVFDADTDEEAVYSMDMHEEDAHVVLAFECAAEARQYAETLRDEEPYDSVASVQALDVAALVITSREADFRVGVVFKGDLATEESASLISSMRGETERLSLSITIVPDQVFADRSSAEFLDPDEDPVYVLVHDEGTGDAQFFSMNLNGTSSIVCFRDADAAERCSNALQSKGTGAAATRSMLLEDLLESICDEDVEVCLVDEVVETLIDDEDGSGGGPGIVAANEDDVVLGTFGADGQEAAQETSVVPNDVRTMLNRLLADDGSSGDQDASQL